MSSNRRNIFICGFIHSGVDWLEEIVRCICHYPLSNNQSDPSIIGCVNTPPESFPDGWFTSKNKILFILRNPKDIVSAEYSKERDSKQDFSSYLENFFSNRSQEQGALSWFDHTVKWGDLLKALPTDIVLIVYFEDLVNNLKDELYKICSFFDVCHDNNVLIDWSDTLSIEEFLQTNGPVRKRRKIEKGNHGANVDLIYEPGRWKRQFMVGQSEAFDSLMRNKMTDSAINIERYL